MGAVEKEKLNKETNSQINKQTGKKNEARQQGPLLSDETFFNECLNLDYPGMETVKAAVQEASNTQAISHDYQKARKAMAAYIRQNLDADRFFEIPYEIPENIYKLPGETDAEAVERICNHTLVSVGIPFEYGKGNPVDWEANPTYNSYKEWTWQLNRHNDIKLLAHEYNKTKNEKIAYAAAELMDSWFKQAVRPDANCAGYMTKCWRTIECGIRMGANWPYILFTFYKTPAFTDDLLIDWYKSVYEHGERLSKNHMTGNWLIMEMNGLGQIGILYPQFKKSEQWLKQALESLEEELDRQIYPDGFQYELTTNYHDVVINNYQRFIEVAYKFGKTVPETLLEKLSRACELDIKLMMPDGTTPDLNDGRRRNVKESYEIRKRILPDDVRAKWITEGDETGKPEYISVAMPWSGFATLRTGWEKNDAWVLMDAAPFGRAHQHEDKLSVLLYANGKLLLTEGGNYAYDESEMRKYVLSTRSHNTVRVDGQDQNRRKTYEWKEDDIRKKSNLDTHFSEKWDYAKSAYDGGYGEEQDKSPVHERSIFFYRDKNKPILIAVDRLMDVQNASTSHIWDVLWHIDSTVEEQNANHIRFADADMAWSAGDTTVITGQETPEWQGFIATETKQGMYRAVPCVDTKTTGNATRIVTVLAPYPAEEKGEMKHLIGVKASSKLADTAITLVFDDGSEWTLDENILREE